jgi:hypothetical protein
MRNHNMLEKLLARSSLARTAPGLKLPCDGQLSIGRTQGIVAPLPLPHACAGASLALAAMALAATCRRGAPRG